MFQEPLIDLNLAMLFAVMIVFRYAGGGQEATKVLFEGLRKRKIPTFCAAVDSCPKCADMKDFIEILRRCPTVIILLSAEAFTPSKPREIDYLHREWRHIIDNQKTYNVVALNLHGHAEIERINPEDVNPHFRQLLTKLLFPFNIDDPAPSIEFIENAIEKHPESWAIVTRNKTILKMAQPPVEEEEEEAESETGTTDSTSGSEEISESATNNTS